MAGPLAGIRVLDVCQLAVGPWSTALLGQLGADVIKIEEPKGDPLRGLQPYMNGVGTYYTAVNLNKHSIALNLKDPADFAIARELAARADVFVENFRPGVMERLGLGYEALSTNNPGIVYCSASGYGHRGPRSTEGCTDGYARSFTGFDSINGVAGGRPQRFRNRGHIDHISSAVVLQAILAGLYARERIGTGQRVETSMMQATMLYQTSRIAEYFATGAGPKPLGSAATNLVPHQAFGTRDGYIAIGCNTQAEWRGLCRGLGAPELIEDQRFTDNAARVEHREALMDLLDRAFAQRTTGEWLAVLEPLWVPCGPFLTFPEIWPHTQVQANEMVVEIEHPWGVVKVAGVPWKFSATPAAVQPAPEKDQHRAEVLQMIREVEPRPAQLEAGEPPAPGGPLGGLRVVELGQGLAAPFAAMQLGDLGAEVVKVEPRGGDWARQQGPPFMAARTGERGESAVFLALNRNKQSIVLDSASEADTAFLRDLIERADVVITDLAPAEATARGLRYEDLAKRCPQLVYCSVTPYGERGPLANTPSGEIVLQAMGDIWRYLGVLGQPPLRLGADAAAMAGGIFAVHGVLAALIHRAWGNGGQKVEVSQLGALLALQTQLIAAQSDSALSGGWHLSAPTEPPELSVQTKDLGIDFGFNARAENGWENFCRAIGFPEQLIHDPRFATGSERTINRKQLFPLLEPLLAGKTAAEVRELVVGLGGLAVIANTYETLFADPQVEAMDMLAAVEHAELGRIQTLGLPWGLSRTPGAIRLPPPTLGHHTTAIKEALYART
jgi:CoA:oxalate CoA-transferase